MKNLLLPAAAILLAATTAAHATTIDFEQYPDFDPITTQYSPEGITFANAVQYVTTAQGFNDYGYPAHSGTGILGDNGANLTVSLATPTSTFSGFYTQGGGGMNVLAYNSAGVLLSTTFFASDYRHSDAFSVSDAGISKLTFVDLSGFNDSLTLDDLTFGDAPISATPEPASLALFGTGLLGALGLVRRRRALGV